MRCHQVKSLKSPIEFPKFNLLFQILEQLSQFNI